MPQERSSVLTAFPPSFNITPHVSLQQRLNEHIDERHVSPSSSVAPIYSLDFRTGSRLLSYALPIEILEAFHFGVLSGLDYVFVNMLTLLPGD